MVKPLIQFIPAGGTKDHLPINGANASQSWQWKESDNSSSDKTNLQEAGAILIDGKVYFFGNKFAFNGTTTIGFRFFQDKVGTIAGGRFSGQHTVNDVLVVADISQGGVVGVIDAYRWVGDGNGTLPNSTKSLVKISTTDGTLGAVVNIVAQPTPWDHQSKAVDPNIMPPVTFIEGFIDLEALFPDRSFCFSSFLVETRSSNPVNSILEDFTFGAFNVQPTVSVVDVTACEGDENITLTAVPDGGIGTLTYAWYINYDPAGTNTPIAEETGYQLTVTESGTYTVIVSGEGIGGGTCPSEPASAEVDINPAPTLAPATDEFCYGDQTDKSLSDCASDVVSGSGYTVSWFSTYIVCNINGALPVGDKTYYATVTNDTKGCSSDTTLVITINADPTVTPATDEFCYGDQTDKSLSDYASDVVSGSGYTVSWFSDSARTLSAASTGGALPVGDKTYYATVTNDTTGCSSDTTLVITINPNPTVSITPVGPFCTTDAAVHLVGSPSSPGTGVFSGPGVSSTGLFNPATANVGGNTIRYTYTDENTCSAYAEITITVNVCQTGEGCTLGYWKNHTDKWCTNTYTINAKDVTISTCTAYGDVFTSAAGKYKNISLIDGLNLGGNSDAENLVRQSIAALLNTCSRQVGFFYSDVNILKAAVNAAWTAGTVNTFATTLDGFNNAGCPLGGTTAFTGSTCEVSTGKLATKAASTNAKESGNITLDSSSKAEQFSAYPVPFKETLNIKYNFDYTSDVTIQIFDMRGQLMRTAKEANASKDKVTTLSVDFARGNQVYVVRVTTDRESFVKQIISQK